MKILGLVIALIVAATPASAAIITLTPSNADGSSNANNQSALQSEMEAALGLTPGSLSEIYKQDQGGSESGTWASSYTTTYSNSPSDPADADLTWDGIGVPDPGVNHIDCNPCYAAVKDGNQQPGMYFFDLSQDLTGTGGSPVWDGWMDILFRDFWPNQGAISNISIWSGPSTTTTAGTTTGVGTTTAGSTTDSVSEPVSLLLLGLGLFGAGARRFRKG